MGEMSFWDRWYWANYLKGTNPITTLIRGLVYGFWIPILASAILCFFIDPQWRHVEGMAQWSPLGYVRFYCYFWGIVFYTCWRYACFYASFFWNDTGSIAAFVRRVIFMN